MSELQEYLQRIANNDLDLEEINFEEESIGDIGAEQLMSALRNNPEVANNIKKISLDSQGFTSIHIPHLPNLKGLYIEHCAITEIDVSHLTSLKFLEISDTYLRAINVTPLVLLEYLDLSSNDLREIDVRPLVKLQILRVRWNAMTKLNASSLIALNELQAQGNRLTAIHVPQSSKLLECFVDNNNLTTASKWLIMIKGLKVPGSEYTVDAIEDITQNMMQEYFQAKLQEWLNTSFDAEWLLVSNQIIKASPKQTPTICLSNTLSYMPGSLEVIVKEEINVVRGYFANKAAVQIEMFEHFLISDYMNKFRTKLISSREEVICWQFNKRRLLEDITVSALGLTRLRPVERAPKLKLARFQLGT